MQRAQVIVCMKTRSMISISTSVEIVYPSHCWKKAEPYLATRPGYMMTTAEVRPHQTGDS